MGLRIVYHAQDQTHVVKFPDVLHNRLDTRVSNLAFDALEWPEFMSPLMTFERLGAGKYLATNSTRMGKWHDIDRSGLSHSTNRSF